MKRRAAIELSVTAIVILILAIVMLGLGLGFVRGMFGKISTQIEEQISTEPEPPIPTASNPITLSREKIITHPKEVNVLKIGVYNPTNYNWVSEAHSEDLIGYWNFDNIDGNIVKDLSGNGNDGTINGDPSTEEGKYGKTLSFDGVDDFVDCGNDNSLDITKEVTVSAWFKTPANNVGGLVWKGNANSDAYWGPYGILKFYGSGMAAHIFLTNSGIDGEYMDLGSIPDSGWHHVAFTWKGSTGDWRGYVDGRLVNSAVKPGELVTTTGRLSIGWGKDVILYPYFNGLIDEVMLFNKALTEEEVQELYETGITPKVVCDSSLMSGLMSSVNGRIIRQGESANFNYLMRLPGNVPKGEYLCKVVLMDYQKDFTIEVRT